jgi:hypothetical protein
LAIYKRSSALRKSPIIYKILKIGTEQNYAMALFIHGEHLTAITYATNFRLFVNEFLTFLRGKEYRTFQINIPDYGSIGSPEQLVRFS